MSFEDIRQEQEYYKKLYNDEVHLYGKDIVMWSLIREMEKIEDDLRNLAPVR